MGYKLIKAYAPPHILFSSNPINMNNFSIFRLNRSYFWFPPSYWHLWEEGAPKSRALAQDTGKDLASLIWEVARLCAIPFHSINNETKTTKTMETTIKTTMQTITTITTITTRWVELKVWICYFANSLMTSKWCFLVMILDSNQILSRLRQKQEAKLIIF